MSYIQDFFTSKLRDFLMNHQCACIYFIEIIEIIEITAYLCNIFYIK